MRPPVYGPRLRRVARQHVGWPRLRPGQLAPMLAVLKHQDALVVLPTGAGSAVDEAHYRWRRLTALLDGAVRGRRVQDPLSAGVQEQGLLVSEKD